MSLTEASNDRTIRSNLKEYPGKTRGLPQTHESPATPLILHFIWMMGWLSKTGHDLWHR